jgi:hypothetical protein
MDLYPSQRDVVAGIWVLSVRLSAYPWRAWSGAEMISITMTVDARADLLDYLESHEDDIALGINDFGLLRRLFCELIGRQPIADMS